MSTTRKLHWFEKTIEYAFVIQHAPQLANAIPLDGVHEKAGDTIFQVEAERWLLIEFKREKGNLSSEETKFTDYTAACKELKGLGAHQHFFVYGKLLESQDLELVAAEFWSRNTLDSCNDLLLTKGSQSQDEFATYVKRVVELKSDTSDGGGGPDFSVIAAVSKDGQVKALASISECFPPKPKPKPKSTANSTPKKRH